MHLRDQRLCAHVRQDPCKLLQTLASRRIQEPYPGAPAAGKDLIEILMLALVVPGHAHRSWEQIYHFRTIVTLSSLPVNLKRHVIVKVDRRAAVLAYIKTFFPIKTNGVVPALHDREVAGVFDTAATRVLLVVLKP